MPNWYVGREFIRYVKEKKAEYEKENAKITYAAIAEKIAAEHKNLDKWYKDYMKNIKKKSNEKL